MRKVATFWKELTKLSLRYLPTSGLANAFTRSASALFQVKRGSSNLPETCSTKTSFCCFLASSAALLGVDTKSTPVPKVEQEPSVLSLALTGEPAQAARRKAPGPHNRGTRVHCAPLGG